MASFCPAAVRDPIAHINGKAQRKRVRDMSEDERQHYAFLYAAHSNCAACVTAWLAQGADPTRGSQHHPDWTALAWAKDAGATECVALLERRSTDRSRSPYMPGYQHEQPRGVWAAPPPPPPPTRPTRSEEAAGASLPDPVEDEPLPMEDEACAVECFEDFFKEPDGVAARVAEAALSGNVKKSEH